LQDDLNLLREIKGEKVYSKKAGDNI